MNEKETRRYFTEHLEVRSPEMHAAAEAKPIAVISGRELQPNRGIPLNPDWINEVRVNTSAVERRAQTLVTRRTVKQDWQGGGGVGGPTGTGLHTPSRGGTQRR